MKRPKCGHCLYFDFAGSEHEFREWPFLAFRPSECRAGLPLSAARPIVTIAATVRQFKSRIYELIRRPPQWESLIGPSERDYLGMIDDGGGKAVRNCPIVRRVHGDGYRDRSRSLFSRLSLDPNECFRAYN